MANRKELHFFDDEEHFRTNTPDYGLYHRHFTPRSVRQLVGEATPIYCYWREAPIRICDYNPAMKWIVVLRNPIERAFSHWNMQRARGVDKEPFWEALTTEAERCAIARPYQHRKFSYVDRGFYSAQLRTLFAMFGREHVLVLRSEELRYERRAALARIADFLTIEEFPSIEIADINVGKSDVMPTSRERAFLLETFEFEIKALERMLGWDCSAWLAP
jgi:hypothetical protein